MRSKLPGSLAGPALLVSKNSSRLALVLLVNTGLMAFSNLAAQVQAPSATDVSPTVNTEVSSVISTGSGYDAWTGSAHRTITDLEVPGAVSSQGLKWTRTYNSASPYKMWSYSYTWRYWGRGWPDPQAVVLPDGGIWRPNEPGMKLRLVKNNISPAEGNVDLYLEDGSMVHMYRYTDLPDDKSQSTIDYITPEYVLDPHGQKTILTYEEGYHPGCGGCHDIRLVKVTDPSGRYIKITYAEESDPRLALWYFPARVEGSDGQWVNYTWAVQTNQAYPNYGAMVLTRVDYSDGTSATYTYGDTTYIADFVCCDQNGNNCHNCSITMPSINLITARDTHADGPMQSIRYDYKSPGTFQGQIRAERHLASNVAVSTFTSTSCPTHSWSTSPDCPSATQTETRGDGPSRTLYIERSSQNPNVPLVKRKSDFNGVNAVFTYDSNNYLLTAKDRNGYITTYTNESVIGNPTRVTHPDGNHIDYTYSDAANPYHIRTVTDELGKTTTYTRGSVGTLTNLITRIDYPDGAYETFSYNGFGQVLTHRRKNGAYDHAAYNGGLLVKLWNPTTTASYPPPDTEPHITLAYYPVGNAWQDRVMKVTYPANSSGLVASEAYEYDRDSNGNPVHGRGLVTKVSHADGTFKAFTYDAFDNKTSETDETGNTTTYTYDDYKRVKTVTNPLNQTTTNDYTATSGTSAYSHTTNSVRRSTSPTGIKTAHMYDNNFRLASEIEAEGSAIPATTTFRYDNNGNQTSVTDPISHVTQTTYDNRNRKKTVTDALSQATTYNYDAASNVTSINRPDATTETKAYDTMHRVLTDTVPQTSTVNLTTTFTYNPSGTLASVKDAKLQLTTFAYDAADLKTKMTYPDNSYRAWTYDNVKNLISRRTVNGVTQNFTYDNRNRKINMSWSNGLDSATFAYDGAGRLVTAANPNSTITHAYDAAGRLTLDRQNPTGFVSLDVKYEYDADGKQTRLYVPGASYDYGYSYDAMGRFETIKPTGGSVAFQYYYDPASNETRRFDWINGVAQIYTRDTLNRMSRRDIAKSGATLSYEVYGYDPMSRLTSVSREDGTTDSFGYYLDGELKTAQYGWVGGAAVTSADMTTSMSVDTPVGTYKPLLTVSIGTPSVSPDTTGTQSLSSAMDTAMATSGTQRSVTYNLDKAGNRTSIVDTGVSKTYSPNNLNEYTSAEGTTVLNNNQHQISFYQGISYGYLNDERFNYAAGGPDSYYLYYDALGRSVKRWYDGSIAYYIYDGEKPIIEVFANATPLAGNLYGKGIDEILARADYTFSPAITYFYQQDHEGSVTHLTDGSGNVIEKYKYDAFGAPTILSANNTQLSASAYDNRFQFTGREFMGWWYEYRARMYHPTLGRFTSEDPKLFDAGDYNLYRYCGNDPEDLTDPMGLTGTSDFLAGFDSFATFGIVGGVVGHFNPSYAAGINTSSASYKAGVVVGAVAGAFDGGTEVKIGGKLLSRAFTREAMDRGLASEARVLKELGEAKNTAKVVGKEGKSIPDFNNKTTIGEIKDTKKVTDSPQLRIQREAAGSERKEHTIVTGTNTKVTEGASNGSTVIRRQDLGPPSPPRPRVDLPPTEKR